MADVELVCKAVLFDMDGVLVDSTPAVARAWRKWAVERGFDPEHTAHIAQGRPSITTIRELLPESDHEAENRVIERMEMEDVEGIVACPGAADLLRSLPPERWVLVTSSTRPLAMVRLRAAGHAVPKFMITGSEITIGKPHPEPFQKAAAMAGFPASECLVIEDTSAGIQSGKAAGCRVLALRTTMPESILAQAQPDWIATSLADVGLLEVTADGDLRLAFSRVTTVM